MLPRLTLLVLLIYVGSLRAANVVASNNVNHNNINKPQQQQQQLSSQYRQPSLMMKGAVDVLRRIVDRVKVGDSKSGVVTSCINGVNCAYNHTAASSSAQKNNDEFGLMKIFQTGVKSLMGDEDDQADDAQDDDDDNAGEDDSNNYGENGLEEGRGKKGKKKKGYGKMIMALAGFTKAVLFYIMLHAVAALAGKALIVAKVALAIATAVALKKSLEHKTSYEIVKHPQYSHSHTHSSSVDYDHGGGGYEGGSRRRRRSHR